MWKLQLLTGGYYLRDIQWDFCCLIGLQWRLAAVHNSLQLYVLLLWFVPPSSPHAIGVLLLATQTHWSFHTYYREYGIYVVCTRLPVLPIHAHVAGTHEQGNHIISLLIRQTRTLEKIKVLLYDTSTPTSPDLYSSPTRDRADVPWGFCQKCQKKKKYIWSMFWRKIMML